MPTQSIKTEKTEKETNTFTFIKNLCQEKEYFWIEIKLHWLRSILKLSSETAEKICNSAIFESKKDNQYFTLKLEKFYSITTYEAITKKEVSPKDREKYANLTIELLEAGINGEEIEELFSDPLKWAGLTEFQRSKVKEVYSSFTASTSSVASNVTTILKRYIEDWTHLDTNYLPEELSVAILNFYEGEQTGWSVDDSEKKSESSIPLTTASENLRGQNGISH